MWTLVMYDLSIRCKRGLMEFSPSGAMMKSAQSDKVQTTDSALFGYPPPPENTWYFFFY